MRKIGWIGAGIMGQPMVIHLLNKGYEVHVYARHPERVEQAKKCRCHFRRIDCVFDIQCRCHLYNGRFS